MSVIIIIVLPVLPLESTFFMLNYIFPFVEFFFIFRLPKKKKNIRSSKVLMLMVIKFLNLV